jgi:hypothetical protein
LDKKVFLSANNFSAGASTIKGRPVVLIFLFKTLFPKLGDNILISLLLGFPDMANGVKEVQQ